MDYKILALDLDGTLTNDKKQITPRTKAAITRAIERAGVTIVLASGRPLIGIWKPARELELQKYGGYLLAYNGAKIVECKSGETVFERVMPREVLPFMCELAREYGLTAYTYDQNGIISEKPPDQYVEVEAFNNAIPVNVVEDLCRAVTWDANKYILSGEHKILEIAEKRLRERFGDIINPVYSYDFFLEVMPAGVEKARSLEWLVNKLGYTRGQVIACGDSLNDVPMIAYAGMGVAMANGYDEAKAVADYIAPSNEEDGVAEAIDRLIFGK